MIAVLAVDPSFGGSQNVKAAFSAIDDTVLLCTYLDEWRKRPAGTIDHHVTKDTAAECAEVVRKARFVFLVGGSSLTVLNKLPGHAEWMKTKPSAAWVTDTFYRQNPKGCNITFRRLGCKKVFALPDATYARNLSPATIPLFHPISLEVRADKPERLTVMHSPGTRLKRPQKGTDVIERVIGRLRNKYDFDYRCLTRLPYEECLRVKAQAHIFIDKLPTAHGVVLGKSGLEAMASESAVICEQSEPEYCAKRFTLPPLFPARDEKTLAATLEHLLTLDRGELSHAGRASRAWIERYWGLENGAWLTYFTRYVKL